MGTTPASPTGSPDITKFLLVQLRDLGGKAEDTKGATIAWDLPPVTTIAGGLPLNYLSLTPL